MTRLAIVLAWVVGAAASAQEPNIFELGTRIKELADEVEDGLARGLLVPRKDAERAMLELVDIRNKVPLDKFTALQQSKWYQAVVYARLSLGRVADASDAAAAWAKAEPDKPIALQSVYDTAVATGDRSAAIKAYRRWLTLPDFYFGKSAKDAPGLDAIKKMNPEQRKKYEGEQEKGREARVEQQANLMSSMGKTVMRIDAPLTDKSGRYKWAKGTGKTVVVVAWGPDAPSSPMVLAPYRKLHEAYGDDKRVDFVAITLYEKSTDRTSAGEAAVKEMIPGFGVLESLQIGGGIYHKVIQSSYYPILAVISPDGVIRYACGPTRETGRQAAFALVAALDSVPEKKP